MLETEDHCKSFMCFLFKNVCISNLSNLDSLKIGCIHDIFRFTHQEEQHKSDLSLKEMEVNKLKQR